MNMPCQCLLFRFECPETGMPKGLFGSGIVQEQFANQPAIGVREALNARGASNCLIQPCGSD